MPPNPQTLALYRRILRTVRVMQVSERSMMFRVKMEPGLIVHDCRIQGRSGTTGTSHGVTLLVIPTRTIQKGSCFFYGEEKRIVNGS
jgi:hypothetical protein